MPEPSALEDTLGRVSEALDHAGVRWALIGAVAVAARGYVRTTGDVDVLLHVERIRVPRLLDALEVAGCSFAREEALRQISEHAVARLRRGDVTVDLVPAVLPYFHDLIGRAVKERIGTREIPVATTEDLVVLKLIAGRLQDRADIAGLLAAAGADLDVAYVRRLAAAHLPAGDPRLAEFERQVGGA